MARQEWKSIPWEKDPKSKQPVDLLIDILCDITNYRAELKGLVTVTEKSELTKNILSTLKELNEWWEEWAVEPTSGCVEIEADAHNSVMQDCEGPILEKLLQYTDVWTAHIICSYDAARILLLELLGFLVPSETSFGAFMLDKPNETPLLGISSDTNALALEIFRSLDYINTHYENFMGTFCVALVLDVAHKALKTNSRMRKWLWAGGDAREQERYREKTCSLTEIPLVLLPTCQISRERWFYQSLKCPVRL
jgi:hypothetical protein